MDDLQTKPLIPEWVTKLAEALKAKTFVHPDDGGWDYIIHEDGLSTEELAEFIWEQIVKDVIPQGKL